MYPRLSLFCNVKRQIRTIPNVDKSVHQFSKELCFRHVRSYLDATFLWVAWMHLFSNCFFPKQLPWKPFLPLLFFFLCLTKCSFWSSWDKIDSLTDFFVSSFPWDNLISRPCSPMASQESRCHPPPQSGPFMVLTWALRIDLILDKARTWKIIPRLLGI